MAAAAVNAERSISKTCKQLGITEKGKLWLDTCLDPFKDLNMPTAGFPDSVVLPSVVEVIHESINVAVPASAGVGSWDANIFLDQLYSTTNFYSTTYSPTNSTALYVGQGATPYSRGGLQIRSGPVGAPLGINDTTGSLSFKSDVIPNADIRIVGLGLEIHNTTPDIDKSGALITYRIGDTPETKGIVNVVYDAGITACVPCSYPKVDLIEPPATASEAIDMPGSLQWEAKDGAYIVAVLNAPENPPLEPEVVFPICLDSDSGLYYGPQIQSGGAAKSMYVTSQPMPTSFSLSGVYLTGLSNKTTLQVNLTYYVEIFPNKNNILRRVSQPSTATDTAALRLYGGIVASLPTGVMVAENFLGGFISGVARIASGIARYTPQIVRGLNTGFEVINTVSDMMNGTTSRTRSSGEDREFSSQYNNDRALVLHNPQPKRVVEVKANSGKEMVVVPNNKHNQIVTVTQVGPKHNPSNHSISRNTGIVLTKGEKGRKRQNQAIRNAIQGNAGNRWVGGKQPR